MISAAAAGGSGPLGSPSANSRKISSKLAFFTVSSSNALPPAAKAENTDRERELVDAIQKEDKVPTGAQAKEMKKASKEGTLTTEAIKQSVAPTKREENPPLKVTLGEEELRPFFPDKRATVPDVKKGIFEALALRQKLQERQAAQKAAAAAKGEAKPPDKPPAGGDKKPPAPGSEKKPEPPAGGAKKPSGPTAGGRGKKPAAPKPKKSNPAR